MPNYRKLYCIPIEGYRHLYRSMLRFTRLDRPEVASLLYALYIGNLDTCQYFDVPLTMMEFSEDGFISLIEPYARPYHTEIQFYCSLSGLLANIQRDATIERTRNAVKQSKIILINVENRFEKVFGCAITDPKTTYSRCWNRLTVRENEPLTIFGCPYGHLHQRE